MKFLCAPASSVVPTEPGAVRIVLYGQPTRPLEGSAGEAAKERILRAGLDPASRAWDLLSIALSVVAADLSCRREESPDGWTREIELEIAVREPDLWNGLAGSLRYALGLLSTDRWNLRFIGITEAAPRPRATTSLPQDGVVLLSGGLDSLVGASDITSRGEKLLAVSQSVRGDDAKQAKFARAIGGGLFHLQLNHNARAPGLGDDSQRARSLIFLSYGALAATSTERYRDGAAVPLYVCENGFIAINPPLTGARLGSLSTRTANPVFLRAIQNVLDVAELRVCLETPYRYLTKGELLENCADQPFLRLHAGESTSCGRFKRFKYRHCGRCVPCQIRRAAFLRWGQPDPTHYVFTDLGRDDEEHAGFDDVRSAAIALEEVRSNGLDRWIGTALSTALTQDVPALRQMISRGVEELANLHATLNVS
jgi:7-cyano-7-deazaguanine synthase in queuosine biosynthesis